MPEDQAGVPSTRPVPNALHVAAAEAEETYKKAVALVFLKMSEGRKDLFSEGQKIYKEAEEQVKAVGADKIMAEHNSLPTAADLDAVAEEQKAAEATSPTSEPTVDTPAAS